MNRRIFASIAACATLASLGASSIFSSFTAFASTTQTVSVKHSAYVIAAPRLHSGRLALEPTGTKLTVESGSTAYWWHVKDKNGVDGYITTNKYYTAASTAGSTNTSGSTTTARVTNGSGSSSGYASTTVPYANTRSAALPPGVSYDASVHAVAARMATNQQKFDAVLHVANSKLGTLYEWGHNEDRGQYGFDCSNFTAYVYHHALGYKMSGASRTQYHSVGWTVPKTRMRPGDLLVFNYGGHVGIYIGNGEMIQCGGGLGKVGYLKVSPGSYWYNHLTVVKRMYQ